HLSKRHSVSSATIRIGAALEQGQRIGISELVVESHFRAVKQQRVTRRIRSILRHRGIDIGTVVEEQIKSRSRLIRVVTQIPVLENHWLTELIASVRISTRLQHRADRVLIVFYDRLSDSKQRRLIAKVPFPRALLLPYLALMPLASFHGHKKSNEQTDYGANSERQADSSD